MKLEALLEKMHDCEGYLERARAKAFDREVLHERDPQSELDTLAALYFPELGSHVRKHSVIYRQQIHAGTILVVELMKAGDDMGARQSAFDTYMAQMPQRWAELSTATDELRAAARRRLVQIMGVEETSAN